MPYQPQYAYPTPQHAAAAAAVTHYFQALPGVEAVLLVNSCARGKAVPDSCLDMAVLVDPVLPAGELLQMEQAWEQELARQPVYADLKQAGLYANTEVYLVDGAFQPGDHGWTSGPDSFELEIGNSLAYSAALWMRPGSRRLQDLKAQWLPYYAEDLRRERLEMVRNFCLNNLDHIPPYLARGLYFQCFDRFYNAYREFLQALFIARRTYPIAYDKWICEQVVEILGLPGLYERLPHLFEIRKFESGEIGQKAEELRDMLEEYCV
jgi:hypothetical protein